MRKLFTIAIAIILVPALVSAAGDDDAARLRASPAYDADGNRVFDDLDARLAAAGADERVDVIVVFSGVTLDAGLDALRSVAADAPIAFEYPTLPGAAVALTPIQIKRTAARDEVRQVELVVEGTRELSTSTHYTGARAVWGNLGFTGDVDGNPDVFTKDDATIAVLDTGIHAAHADFAGGKLIAWHDTVTGRTTPFDNDGHGTHVSSIAAGLGLADESRTGVAPGASLVVVRISNKAHAAAAVEWVMANKETHGIDVMTMSFGFGIGRDGTDSLALLFDAAFEAGIVTVKSTGNSGPEHSTMTIPGDAHHILAVGALEDPGKTGWKLATFSSRGPTTDGRMKPDISAPGYGISAAASGTTNGYVSLSGTSMAAPHIAGMAALVKSANPALSAAEIRQILVDTAEDVGFPGADNDFGAGIADPYAAVKRALGESGRNPVAAPRVLSLHTPTGAPAVWLVDVEDGAHRLSVTALTEGEGAARNFRVLVAGPGGYFNGGGVGQRHANFDIPNPQAGAYSVSIVGAAASTVAVVSADYPADAPVWHGAGIVAPIEV